MVALVRESCKRLARRILPEPAYAFLKRTWRSTLPDWTGRLRGSIRLCRVRHEVIRINVSNYLEKYRAKTYATKEPDTLDWIDRHLHEGDVLFDVGANIGLYSLYAAKVCPGARVFAFEPESLNFSRLCANIVRNGLRNITPCCLPITSEERFDYLQLNEFEVGSSCHGFGEGSMLEFIDRSSQPFLRQGAIGVSIDRLVAAHGLPAPHLVKVDVDGIEERVVAGAVNTLRGRTVRSALIEITVRGQEVSPIERTLADAGFKVVGRGKESVYGEFRCRNVIFDRA